ncbi:hypothetical protein MPSEU_001089500 [Mayamaea pseudoterrestris]|nr:hypothetical protein MPSEU_001089500 [Mayamaea pseudoterrestris]
MEDFLEDKALEIEAVLNEEVVDLWRLRELALSEGGLVHDSLRKRAWPKLVGLHDVCFFEQVTAAEPPIRRESASSITVVTNNTTATALAGLPPRPPLKSNTNTSSARASLALESLSFDANPVKPECDSDNNSVASDHSTASTGSDAPHEDHNQPLLPQSICLDADQISLDVLRCTWHLLTGTQRLQRIQMEHKRNRKVARLIRRKQQRLALLINATLTKTYYATNTSSRLLKTQPLRYYQGYHDVACIFLSALGGVSGVGLPPASPLFSSMAPPPDANLASAVLLQVSQFHLRDCLQTNFAALQTVLRCTIFPLIALLDPQVHEHLYEAGMEPFFALSWVVTWFAHEVRDTQVVKRLFDAFLVGHSLLPVYVSVAMVIHSSNRAEILDCECDFSLLHQTLRGLPKNSSIVGWKYRPGDGYVSDDEQNDEDGTVSTMESGTAEEAEILLVERLDHDYHKIQRYNSSYPREDVAASCVSSNLSSLMEPPATVSFQELIDDALDIMRRVPPRKILRLATRYYGKQQMENMLAECNVIHMFDPDVPVCMTASTAKADWVYRQEAKECQLEDFEQVVKRGGGQSRSSRWSRNGNLTSEHDELLATDQQICMSTQYIKKHMNSSAVVALGFGNNDDEERKRRLKRRRRMMSITVALIAVAIGISMRYGTTQEVHDGTPSHQVLQHDAGDLKQFAAASVTTDSATSNTLKKSTMTELSEMKNPAPLVLQVDWIPQVNAAAATEDDAMVLFIDNDEDEQQLHLPLVDERKGTEARVNPESMGVATQLQSVTDKQPSLFDMVPLMPQYYEIVDEKLGDEAVESNDVEHFRGSYYESQDYIFDEDDVFNEQGVNSSKEVESDSSANVIYLDEGDLLNLLLEDLVLEDAELSVDTETLAEESEDADGGSWEDADEDDHDEHISPDETFNYETVSRQRRVLDEYHTTEPVDAHGEELPGVGIIAGDWDDAAQEMCNEGDTSDGTPKVKVETQRYPMQGVAKDSYTTQAGRAYGETSGMIDAAAELSAQVAELVSSISMPVWGRVRDNCTSLFAVARGISIREAARTKSYIDYVQRVGLGTHLERMLDGAHEILADHRVCKRYADPIHVIARARFGLAEAATKGLPAQFIHWFTALLSSQDCQIMKRHLKTGATKVQQFSESYYYSYLIPRVSLLQWMFDGVLEEVRLSSPGQWMGQHWSKWKQSLFSQRIHQEFKRRRPEVQKVIARTTASSMYLKYSKES